jgi:hypothetical protein
MAVTAVILTRHRDCGKSWMTVIHLHAERYRFLSSLAAWGCIRSPSQAGHSAFCLLGFLFNPEIETACS